MRSLGKVVVAFFALIIFTSASLWVFTKNSKPEAIKAFVAQQISTLTHKESHINGDISWQLFPRPSLKVEQVQIGNNTEDYFATIDSLAFNLKITPLLKGSLLFNELAIDKLLLKVNQNAVKQEKTPALRPHNMPSHHEEFAIQKITLTRSQIAINNHEEQTTLKNIQLVLEDFNLNKGSFPIQIKARVNRNDPITKIKSNLSFTGRIKLNQSVGFNALKELFSSEVEGQLVLQDSMFNHIAVDKINTTIKTNKENIEFNPFTVSLYGGEAVGTMNYKLDTHQISLNQTATNLDGRKLLTALLGHKMISGTMDYSIHASFSTEKPALSTFDGNGQITLKEGKLYNLNVDEFLNRLKEKLGQIINGEIKDINALKNLNKEQLTQGGTPFKLASVDYQLKDEQLSTHGIILQTDKLYIKGGGSINLLNHNMNSKLQVNITNSDQNMQKIQSLVGGYFPLAVSGTIEHPYITPDFKSINPILSQLLINPAIQQPIKLIGGLFVD